jgi:O-methyltransferase involved in polyketide biosynthesis
LLLAEGLFMYLTSDDVAGVLRAATERIARGRVAFDAVAPWVVRASALQPAMRQAGTRFRSGLPSVSILEREHPRLRIRDELSFVELLLEQPLTASYRAMLTLLRRLPGFRNAMRLVQFDMRPI